MILDANCQLDYQTADAVTAVFMLRPRSGWAQWVMQEGFQVSPQVPVVEFADVYGNLCQRMVMPPGRFRLSVHCRVRVAEKADVDQDAPLMLVEDLPTELLHYLLPSRYCQSDSLLPLATYIVGDAPPTYQRVARIQEWIRNNVRNEPGSSNTSTSAIETADSLCGVCRDFAHLGIALCRAISVPARMVVGFLHELRPMDLHAWFEAYLGGRWFTFDATQATTSGGRIIVAYGRDAADVALATLFGPFSMESMNVSVCEVENAVEWLV